MFRKSFFVGLITACVAVVAGYGVSKSVNNDTDLEVLTLGNVEALAGGEGFWNDVWNGIVNSVQGQGWTKDEREIQEQCPNWTSSSGSGSASYGGASGSASGSHSQGNPNSRTDIRCGVGKENCSAVPC
ncbi:NVEALA domain-containing protein [Capnocytophaga cynodegmi]|uniref:Uncharacterized protein n=1 Tax=Capnocytophaga cynodegmi TaxID=28189 RepID=A0A0B7HDQ9_9FLAO|nr:NVEALA domain-containing protein [Capnocytophaga cynodegmi]CEN36754.1 exported hypothetical protein [Capnocytophaga cynodegmi]